MKLKVIIPILIAIIIVPLAITRRVIGMQNGNVKVQSNSVQASNINNSSQVPPDENTSSASSSLKSTIPVLKESARLDTPVVEQNPELYNGCEVSSLAMLLQYKGIEVDKMTLADQIKKDTTPLVCDKDGNIISWGDPNNGFVGDITGKNEGYGVYNKPLTELLEKYMPGKSVDLTGKDVNSLYMSIQNGNPVVVWVTIDLKPDEDFVTWECNGKEIKATFDEHAVLLVGYDKNYIYINNPYTGQKNEKISKDTFEAVWKSMGCMAVSCT